MLLYVGEGCGADRGKDGVRFSFRRKLVRRMPIKSCQNLLNEDILRSFSSVGHQCFQ